MPKKLRDERDAGQMADGYVPIPVAAKALGVSEARVYAMAAEGLLERRKVGGAVYVAMAAVRQHQKELKVPAGWISIREAAQAYSYARTTLLYRVQRGELEAREIGGRTYLRRAALDKLLGAK